MEAKSWAKITAKCQEMREKYMNEHFLVVQEIMPEVLVPEEGKRYVRVMSKSKNSNSAWAFVDKTNGDVLKPASWKAPAKHARGNIFDQWNGMKWIGPYGPAYLR
jgi:hypothetical protein